VYNGSRQPSLKRLELAPMACARMWFQQNKGYPGLLEAVDQYSEKDCLVDYLSSRLVISCEIAVSNFAFVRVASRGAVAMKEQAFSWIVNLG
jgi:hypothetical protein